MVTGLTLGIIGAVIWITTHLAETQDKIKMNTATAWFCVSIMLIIASFMFMIASLHL